MNQLKKKRSLFSVLMDNECFVLCTFILIIIAWIFGTYYVGKLEQYIEITLFHGSEPLEHVLSIWMGGFIVESVLAIAIMGIGLLKRGIVNIVKTISVAKILQFLPVSEEEIKILNISSYESFEAALINLFKDAPKEISNSAFFMVERALFDTIFEYLKFDDATVCEFYDTTDKSDSPKAEFARLRSEVLTMHLFKNEELSMIENTIKDVKKKYSTKKEHFSETVEEPKKNE